MAFLGQGPETKLEKAKALLVKAEDAFLAVCDHSAHEVLNRRDQIDALTATITDHQRRITEVEDVIGTASKSAKALNDVGKTFAATK